MMFNIKAGNHNSLVLLMNKYSFGKSEIMRNLKTYSVAYNNIGQNSSLKNLEFMLPLVRSEHLFNGFFFQSGIQNILKSYSDKLGIADESKKNILSFFFLCIPP